MRHSTLKLLNLPCSHSVTGASDTCANRVLLAYSRALILRRRAQTIRSPSALRSQPELWQRGNYLSRRF